MQRKNSSRTARKTAGIVRLAVRSPDTKTIRSDARGGTRRPESDRSRTATEKDIDQ